MSTPTLEELMRGVDAFLEHLDEREGEDLRELGKPKAVTLEVEAEGVEGPGDCATCLKGEKCPEHPAGDAEGIAEKLAALGGE